MWTATARGSLLHSRSLCRNGTLLLLLLLLLLVLLVLTLGTRGFSRVRREFSVFARVTIKTWQKPETALEKSLEPRVPRPPLGALNSSSHSSVSAGSSPRSYLFISARGQIGVHTPPKYGIKPIQYVTLHFRDRCGVASLRHKNRAATTVLLLCCVQVSNKRRPQIRTAKRQIWGVKNEIGTAALMSVNTVSPGHSQFSHYLILQLSSYLSSRYTDIFVFVDDKWPSQVWSQIQWWSWTSTNL